MKGDTMKKDYRNNQKANIFLIGFSYQGNIYRILLSIEVFMKLTKYDKTSKSHGKKPCLRFKPTANQKRALINLGATCWSNEATFQEKILPNENKGQTFERIMKKEFNGMPCKNRCWWNGGDFEYYNKIYQVKYENATVCTAEQCRRVRG